MSIGDPNSVEGRLSILEKKIELIAQKLNINFISETPKVNTEEWEAKPGKSKNVESGLPKDEHSEAPEGTHFQQKEYLSAGKLLGFAGVGCLILAMILLIRLSIDSGWLTPERQLIMAALFGAALIVTPLIGSFKDLAYISQLPAAGIVVFHLTVLGGVYYHGVIDPAVAILLVSAIGIFSMALVYIFKYESYAVLSIVGTYLGALCLKSGFPSRLAFVSFIMVWNCVYCFFAIELKKRKIILLVSYLAIALVSLKVIGIRHETVEYLKVAGVQALQFVVFFLAVVLYSVKNRAPLTRAEGWTFFPLILFFYFLEYHLLDRVGSNYATAMAFVFSMGILGVYKYARRGLNQAHLDSSEIVYMVLATIFAHAIYFSLLNDIAQVVVGYMLIMLATIFRKRLFGREQYIGAVFILGLVCAYSALQLFVGSRKMPTEFLIGMGFLYGVSALIGYLLINVQATERSKELSNELLLLLFAHSQVLLAIYRLKDFIDQSMIAPLWIAYAFILFVRAYQTKVSEIAKSAMPIVLLGLLRFMVVDFSSMEGGERIISLIIMGGLIFIGGYTYRKISFDRVP